MATGQSSPSPHNQKQAPRAVRPDWPGGQDPPPDSHVSDRSPTGQPGTTAKPEKMATITAGSYAFSRYPVAALIWLSLILQRREILFAVLLLLLASVLLSISRDPLVVIYRQTLDRIWPSHPVQVEVNGLRFAHALGSLVCIGCLVTLYFGKPPAGWYFTGFFAVFKTVSAVGFCPGLNLYHLIRRTF